MSSFKHVSHCIPGHSGLRVCIADTSPVKVLQWQCRGELMADLERGVYATDSLHIDKAKNFIHLAKRTCADLVLTPEYSFPCEVLDIIVGDKELWPGKGSLWCLGMQGYARQEFTRKLGEWAGMINLSVVRDAFEQIKESYFIDTLIYLFMLDDGRLCILPQFKTVPMAEPWNDYETRGLCNGDLIYVFDLCGKSDDLNRFLSILCSDVLCVNAQNILNETKGMDLTIFHAQLNQEPRHEAFTLFRKSFFEKNTRGNIRLITLNWAEGTTVDGQPFSKPWSAFYKKSNQGLISGQKLRMKNHDKGTYYALNRYTEIWYSDREEHCKQFDINKGFDPNAFCAATAHYEPTTQEYYQYNADTKSWCSGSKDQRPALVKLIGRHGADYDFPLDASPHDSDVFFGLCFGHFLEGELRTENELVTRLFSGSDDESDQKRKAKAEQYKKLIRLIRKQNFPPALKDLIDNHEFYLDSATAEEKNKYGNVYPKTVAQGERNPFSSALFVISGCTRQEEIESLVDRLGKSMHPNMCNRVVVYYFSLKTERYECFSEHLNQTRIDKATYSKSLSSIKG